MNATALVVLLNGKPIPEGRIRYAGAAPGFAGLYQINLSLPDDTPPSPTLSLQLNSNSSLPNVKLPLR